MNKKYWDAIQMSIRIKIFSFSNPSIVFIILFFFFISLLPSQYYCVEVYNITFLQPLAEGQTLVSPGLIFELGFFSPNDSSGNKYVGIWHKNILPRKAIWVANREKPLEATGTLATLTMNRNGNLELVDGKQKSVWSTNISVQSNGSAAAAVLLDNGNLVVEDNIRGLVWMSFDYLGDTLLPGAMMGFDTKSGKRSILTSWKSESDPSSGLFWFGLAQQIPTQAFIWMNNGSTPHWRSGAWDRSKFIGIQGMDDQYLTGYDLDDNVQQGTVNSSYSLFGKLGYFEISSKGTLKLMYSEHGENWDVHWEAQRNPCDDYGTCGPFGVCKASDNSSESPTCKCLKGFKPVSYNEWSQGNWTGGCVRQAPLFCVSNTNTSQPVTSRGKQDRFWKIEGLKLPDFHEYISSSGAEDCKTQCLNTCSCLAYSHVQSIGCLVWSKSKDLFDIQKFTSGGVDLNIRLAHEEVGEGMRVKLIVSLTAIFFSISMATIVFGLHRLRANQKGNIKVITGSFELTDSAVETSRHTSLQEYIRKHDPPELLIYDFDSISVATRNFSVENKLGEGGFGPVYRGKLQGGKEIAVKRLSSKSGQGTEEFKNEMLLISKLQHKNLVRLMGCSIKHEEKLLIYEFMPNKSLDTLLFDPMSRAVLDWAKRLNIIQGVARGLLYLHHDSCLKIIHRDLKVSNILLDENMNPKISDFGLARIVQGTQNLENTQKVVGTLGYMSPEYAMGGIFSEKSDVYSFGVLLLEITCGRKNNSVFYHDQPLGFLAYTWDLWTEGRTLYLVDEALADSYSASEVMRCVQIGLLCVQDNAEERPTMTQVIFMLSSETDLPQPKRPIFTFQNSVYSSPHSLYANIFSANEASITLLEGR